jgi:4-hydroxybenzoate polyprenyltransferase
MQGLATFVSISRLHIVAIAALGTFTFGWLFTGRYLWGLAALSALDWFIVNLLNRVVDLDEDRVNRITGVAFVDQYRRTLTVLGFVLLIGSLAATAVVAPALAGLRLAFQSLGLAYNWPILPGRRRIKALYFWKNTASAIGFMLTVFGFPLAVAGWGADPSKLAPGVGLATILISGGFFFLFELSWEVIYDLRDEPGDRAADVRTYPVVHGVPGAMRIIDALLAASSAILVGGYVAGVVPWRIVVMVLAPALNFVAYRRFMRRGLNSTDCIRLTWLGTGLLVAYHLWVVAGLPGVGLPAR